MLFTVRLVMQTREGLIWIGRVSRHLSDYMEDTVFMEMPLSQWAGQALAFSALGVGAQLCGARVLVPAPARGVSLVTCVFLHGAQTPLLSPWKASMTGTRCPCGARVVLSRGNLSPGGWGRFWEGRPAAAVRVIYRTPGLCL